MSLKQDRHAEVVATFLAASRDKVLLALWVCCYQILRSTFSILNKLEGQRHLSGDGDAVTSGGA